MVNNELASFFCVHFASSGVPCCCAVGVLSMAGGLSQQAPRGELLSFLKFINDWINETLHSFLLFIIERVSSLICHSVLQNDVLKHFCIRCINLL